VKFLIIKTFQSKIVREIIVLPVSRLIVTSSSSQNKSLLAIDNT